MKKWILLAASAGHFSTAWGTVTEPWHPERAVELQARADVLFQAFDVVESSGGDFSYRSRDIFLDISALGSLEGFGAEIEAVLSNTKAHTIYPDCFKLTGRYQFLNDSAGDLFSLMAGITVIAPTTEGLDDIGSFHHGHFEAEAHLAIGSESVCRDQWRSRVWALAAIGCAADAGSPWVRANFNYEMHWRDDAVLRGFVNTLWGLGGNAIYRHRFHGYGSIAHRSVDIGAALRYTAECDLTVSFGYAYRVYAHDFPKNANLFTVDFLYPFSL